MPHPKTKTSKRRKRERRSHLALKPVKVITDKDGNPHLPHHASPVSGEYKGKKVVDVEKRTTRRIARVKKAS
jgi:ribosomal protein L32